MNKVDIFVRTCAALSIAAAFLSADSNSWILLISFTLIVFSILYSIAFREKVGHGTIQVFRNGDENRRINLELDLAPEEMEKLDTVIFKVDVRAENT